MFPNFQTLINNVYNDEIIRLNSIQDERVFSCCLLKENVIQWVTQA